MIGDRFERRNSVGFRLNVLVECPVEQRTSHRFFDRFSRDLFDTEVIGVLNETEFGALPFAEIAPDCLLPRIDCIFWGDVDQLFFDH